MSPQDHKHGERVIAALRERGLGAEDSIRYAFKSVGAAIVMNTVILAAGFAVLLFSDFKVNADMGLLTSMAIVFALVLDFLLLPALLMLRSGQEESASQAALPASAQA